jgi:hypothetical protein
MAECTNLAVSIDVETRESPGVLPLSDQERPYQVEIQPMTLGYKMLLLRERIDNPDQDGRVPLDAIALKFKDFFQERLAANKEEENPNSFHRGRLSDRSIKKWKAVVREQPVEHFCPKFIVDEVEHLKWAPEIWTQWSPDLKRELRDAAMRRLIAYFQKYVPG